MSTSVNAYVVVEKIKMPAWLLQNNKKIALEPGMTLYENDTVITGKSAKIYLKLEEGSRIKLGEFAQFNISSVVVSKDLSPKKDDLFSAIFDVVKGAFRFTTNELFKNRRRQIDINIGTITAGIRGTDLWGKSDKQNDLVCLINGGIKVSKEGSQSISLSDPSSYVSASRKEQISNKGSVSSEDLNKWAALTEIPEKSDFVSTSGKFSVQLLSVVDKNDAYKISKTLNNEGYNASVMEIIISGQEWFRVSINGFESIEGARDFANSIDGQFSITGPWVNNRI